MDTGKALIILSVVVLWLAIAALVGWVIGAIFGYAIRWLLKRKQVQGLVLAVQEGSRQWWNRHQVEAEGLFEFFWEIFIDPLFFAYVVFVLFNRFASITDYTQAHPESSFWQMLNLDMERDVNLYMWFLVIFSIWMMGKAWAHSQQTRERRTMTKALYAIAKKLGVEEGEYKTTPKEGKGEDHFDSVL